MSILTTLYLMSKYIPTVIPICDYMITEADKRENLNVK
jgi:hypothetical protein